MSGQLREINELRSRALVGFYYLNFTLDKP